MFLRKKFRDADRKVPKFDDFMIDSDGHAVIAIKAERKNQIFSEYDYDSNEKLNEELGSHIISETRFVPANRDLRIKVYTNEQASSQEVENAIRNKFKKDYNEMKIEQKRNLFFCLTMLLVGLTFLSVLLLSYAYFPNDYLDIFLEICAWVFLWEAVDAFFLRRISLKNKQIHHLQIITAKIEVIKLEDIKKI